MGHPLRMRIIRLCLDEARTNKELADLLRKDPATVLHHVRILARHGFIEAAPPRNGNRGALEKPYRTTGLSLRLDVEAHEPDELARRVELAVVDAFRAELDEAGAGALRTQTRMPLRLNQASQEEMSKQLQELLAQFINRNDADGERLSLLLSMHVRPAAG
jgi:DNA-binding transcriptional ArsR family regulator